MAFPCSLFPAPYSLPLRHPLGEQFAGAIRRRLHAGHHVLPAYVVKETHAALQAAKRLKLS
jgi:hypothetical protein